MDEEQAFKDKIKQNPDDLPTRLVFSDFLEEQGEAERAKFQRDYCATAARPDSLSDDQAEVVGKINRWMDNPDGPYLTLGGYAGTGKSTIIRHLVDSWENTAVAALCGKAANVLRRKGLKEARTIHSLIYEPIPHTKPVQFRRREHLGSVDRIVIDEASMVDEQILADLVYHDIPILFVGDHGQLEPVGRDVGLMRNPTLTLTKIHRQAEGNPIIRLSRAFREGKPVPYWEDPAGRLSVVSKAQFWEILNPGSVMICAYNKTRHRINRECRAKLGLHDPLPVPGDRLVCLRNNGEYKIFNGQLAMCLGRGDVKRGEIALKLRLDDDQEVELPCVARQFGIETLTPQETHRGQCLWDFGYGLTAHKSQGSEFEEVIVLDQQSPLWNMNRWRYTAATRAQQRLIYCM